jgi:CheY-like chemotaxis protein
MGHFEDRDMVQWKVLVVDDEPDNAKLIQMYLNLYGVHVVIAEDGSKGLQALEHLTPTLILCDLAMPTMDGFEMLARMRTNPRTARIPVIALTAHATWEYQKRVKAAGFDAYVSKPMAFPQLVQTMKTCLVRPR